MMKKRAYWPNGSVNVVECPFAHVEGEQSKYDSPL